MNRNRLYCARAKSSQFLTKPVKAYRVDFLDTNLSHIMHLDAKIICTVHFLNSKTVTLKIIAFLIDLNEGESNHGQSSTLDFVERWDNPRFVLLRN